MVISNWKTGHFSEGGRDPAVKIRLKNKTPSLGAEGRRENGDCQVSNPS